MGIIVKKEEIISKKKTKISFEVSPEYSDDAALAKLYDDFIFYKPELKLGNLAKINSELRRINTGGLLRARI